jgi:hypothetical protein
VLTFTVGEYRITWFPWPLFMTFDWGVGLLSHYLSVYSGNTDIDPAERDYQKLKESE